MAVGLLGVGKAVPKRIVTNDDLSKIMDTSDEWIRTRTGIHERRIAEDDVDTSDLAYEAAQIAIEREGISAEEIGLIVVATVTPDTPFPTVSNRIQDRLGATNAAAMDISAACSGFIYGLATAAQFVENGTYPYVLVVGVEKLSKIIDWTDRNTAVLFGDGAGAAVVGAVSEGKGIHAFELGSDGSGGEHLHYDGHIQMNGREVFKFAVRTMGSAAVRVTEKAGLSKEDVDYIIPHQANTRIMDAARKRLGLPKEKMSQTIHKYGNTSAASIPISLFDDLEEGRINDGDTLVLVGFGGGLTWGAMCLTWGQ